MFFISFLPSSLMSKDIFILQRQLLGFKGIDSLTERQRKQDEVVKDAVEISKRLDTEYRPAEWPNKSDELLNSKIREKALNELLLSMDENISMSNIELIKLRYS
jgi:hypothetical protein